MCFHGLELGKTEESPCLWWFLYKNQLSGILSTCPLRASDSCGGMHQDRYQSSGSAIPARPQTGRPGLRRVDLLSSYRSRRTDSMAGWSHMSHAHIYTWLRAPLTSRSWSNSWRQSLASTRYWPRQNPLFREITEISPGSVNQYQPPEALETLSTTDSGINGYWTPQQLAPGRVFRPRTDLISLYTLYPHMVWFPAPAHMLGRTGHYALYTTFIFISWQYQ